MKFPGEASERVARVLLARGAATVSELAHELRLSPQAIRRSLGALEDSGFVQTHDRAPFGPGPQKRRGRPSASFSLTTQGRNALNQSYDDLALESLKFIEEKFGRDAVRAFAAERAQRIITGKSIPELVEALNNEGYEATFEQAGISGQLCQHHCPVVDAAKAYPELCEEETRALGESLGTHPTRLATLAVGDAICTTLIPLNNLDRHFRNQDHQATTQSDAMNTSREEVSA